MTDARISHILQVISDLSQNSLASAIDALTQDGPMTEPMARWALDTTLARYSQKSLEQIARYPVEEFCNQRCAVLLAQSVAVAPLRAIIVPYLHGAASVLVRASSNQQHFVSLIVQLFSKYTDVVRLWSSGSSQQFVASLPSENVACLVAYGADETLEKIAANLDRSIGLYAHGHGWGTIIVDQESVQTNLAYYANAIARDVAHYDQHGCLSPQCVLLIGDREFSLEFCGRITQQLDELSVILPRYSLSMQESAMCLQWQGTMAARAHWFRRGKQHSIALLTEREWTTSPGWRNIPVIQLESLDQAHQLLAPVAHWLTTIATTDTLMPSVLPQGAKARLVPVGQMQNPPLDGDGYEDPRPCYTPINKR